MNHIYWLSQLKFSEQSLVGEKVLILSRLLQRGYPILPGYIVGTPVLQEFLQALDDSQSLIGNLSDSSLYVDVDNYRVLQSFAQKSRQIILETEFPPDWQAAIFNSAQKFNSPTLILRPSLVLPYSPRQRHTGLLRSQVCLCQPEAISLGIKQVWGELFSAKSVFYWQKLGISLKKIKLAVLIQPLGNAIASGIVEIKANSIQIQANWGLGHSLVRGEVQPDIYAIERTTGVIRSQRLGNKFTFYDLVSEATNQNLLRREMVSEQKHQQYTLGTAEIQELAQLVAKIVTEEQKISSLEWILSAEGDNCLAQSQFFLTQLHYYPASSE